MYIKGMYLLLHVRVSSKILSLGGSLKRNRACQCKQHTVTQYLERIY